MSSAGWPSLSITSPTSTTMLNYNSLSLSCLGPQQNQVQVIQHQPLVQSTALAQAPFCSRKVALHTKTMLSTGNISPHAEMILLT